MDKRSWIIASVLSVLLVVGLIGFTAWQSRRALDHAESELADARKASELAQAQLAALKKETEEARAKIEELRQEKEQAGKLQKNLEDEMRAALESKDVTISQLQGKLTVTILDRILFDSGEAELRGEGERVLRQIATVLAQYPKRQIHVIGHTDNVPIRAGSRGRYASNWELSTARATSAVRFLQEKAAVDPRRLGAVGYGEFHPIADNTTADGRAKNRRIALVVLPEELGAADLPKVPAPVPAVVEKPPTPDVNLPKED